MALFATLFGAPFVRHSCEHPKSMQAPTSPDVLEDCPVVLFDGVCGLCDAVVNFVVAHERAMTLRFAPLQSAFAATLVDANPSLAGLDSVLLFEGGRVHARSDAALRIARYLRWPWRGLALLRVVPRFLRDAVYDLVAARRHRWFGRKDACRRPSRLLKERFLS
jgi:predicted DCC family thiol-disulfide oxidoreductase YuxK